MRRYNFGIHCFLTLKILDLAMYNSVINDLCDFSKNDVCEFKFKRVSTAMTLLYQMEEKGFIPDESSYDPILEALFKLREPHDAMKLYNSMTGKVFVTVVTDNIVLEGLMNCRRLWLAISIFEGLPYVDTISYTSMIKGFFCTNYTVRH